MPEGENFFHQVNIASQREIFEQTYFPFFLWFFLSLEKADFHHPLTTSHRHQAEKNAKKYLLERIQFWFWNGAVKTKCKKHFCPDKFLLWFCERLIMQSKMARARLQLQSFNSWLIYLRKSNRHNSYFDVTVLFETGNETRYHASIFQSSITSFDKLTFILPSLLPNLFMLPITSIATNILRVGSK